MNFIKYCLIILVILGHLFFAQSSWADQGKSPNKADHFQVGQRVIWLYKAHGGYGNIQKIPAEVVKLGGKKIQIQVKKNDQELVKRWVSKDKLLKPSI